jgi:FRG domain
LPSGWSEDDPLEDVYQAALRMEISQVWLGNIGMRKIFRGQRRHVWKVIPRLFRIEPDSLDNSDSLIMSRIKKINRIVRQIQASYQGISDEQGVAIVQHYSEELGTGTWLIDFTWDPFVALFFASDGGQEGDLGIISYIGLGEFNRFSAGGTNRIGKIRVIEADGFPRIEAQKAIFLDTSHPDLYEQFVPHTLYFRQMCGLCFEDPARTPPVTKSTIYPEKDPFIENMNNFQSLENVQPLTFKSASDASHPMSYQEYEKIAKSWFKSKSKQLKYSYQKVVEQVCRVYANLQQHRDEIDLPSRSLHKLENAIDFIQKFDNPTLKLATEPWVWRHEKEYELIVNLIEQVDVYM